MRVTLQSLGSHIQSTLGELAARQAQQQTRIATGQRLLSLGDAPESVSAIVSYRSTISRMERYQAALHQALDENATTEDALQSINSTLSNIHTLGIDVLQIANHDKWATLAQNVLSKIKALIEAANISHGDVYVLSGTKNTASVLQPSPPESTTLPFELISDVPTPSNPSGLRVVFKGNTDARYTLTGDASSEQVSTTADKVFGNNGTATFDTLIKLYNTLAYAPDGTPRGTGQLPTQQELDTVAGLITQIANASTMVAHATSELAIRTDRMNALHDQLTEDLTRQREFLSRLNDTDVAQATLQLQRDQLAYEYSLKVSARLLNLSLFDFLQ